MSFSHLLKWIQSNCSYLGLRGVGGDEGREGGFGLMWPYNSVFGGIYTAEKNPYNWQKPNLEITSTAFILLAEKIISGMCWREAVTEFTNRHMLGSFVQNEKLLHLKTLSTTKDMWTVSSRLAPFSKVPTAYCFLSGPKREGWAPFWFDNFSFPRCLVDQSLKHPTLEFG